MGKQEKGFTLLEVLAVVAIIGILASFIIPKVSDSVAEAKENACQANIKYIEGVLERYKLALGDYPANLAALADWYQHEFPLCPKPEDELEGTATGYYYNNTDGQVAASSGEGAAWIEITN